jgi:Fe-S cluster assembly protein SufD
MLTDMAIAERQDIYRNQFDRQAAGEARSTPDWLRSIRREAIERFGQLGFPSVRHEEWRFTNVTPIAERTFAPASDGARGAAPVVSSLGWQAPGLSRVVFVNGRYDAELSSVGALPDRVEVGSLAGALARGEALVEQHLTKLAGFEAQPFVALNTAFLADGAFVRIPANTVLDSPIELLFVSAPGSEPTVSHPRVLVVAGENCQATIVESYAGPAGERYFTNAVTEIVAGQNAVVDHYKVQRESLEAFHIANMHLLLDRSVTFSSHAITVGGSLVRNDILAVLNGEGVDCTLNGLYVVNGQRLVDNHTTIDHAQPHCGSHEVYKGILADRGRGVFNGKIIVRPDAQKTDAKQTNKALLLSEDAQINTKPQLEIFADDVKCTHGATVGQLDEDALFYLRCRGIGEADARKMLIRAFLGDILTRVKVEALRRQLDHDLLDQLPGVSPDDE